MDDVSKMKQVAARAAYEASRAYLETTGFAGTLKEWDDLPKSSKEANAAVVDEIIAGRSLDEIYDEQAAKGQKVITSWSKLPMELSMSEAIFYRVVKLMMSILTGEEPAKPRSLLADLMEAGFKGFGRGVAEYVVEKRGGEIRIDPKPEDPISAAAEDAEERLRGAEKQRVSNREAYLAAQSVYLDSSAVLFVYWKGGVDNYEIFGACCNNCYNSHGSCIEHGNCPCHPVSFATPRPKLGYSAKHGGFPSWEELLRRVERMKDLLKAPSGGDFRWEVASGSPDDRLLVATGVGP
jgi:hypothetical protein